MYLEDGLERSDGERLRALPLPLYIAGERIAKRHNHFPIVNADGHLTCIDLFAGCGGLSLGLEKAGFRSVLAVEKSPMAAETFYHNFIKRLPDGEPGKREWAAYCELPVEEQAERRLIVNEVAALLERGHLLDELKALDIDLVAGGPPCQGFSMAGRRIPSDIRNQLPWQFLEVVERVTPKAVVIENVVGIGQDFLKHGAQAPFAQLRIALESTGPGYVAQPMRVNAMHFGVPQHRPRMLLVALRSDVAEVHNLKPGLAPWRSEMEIQPVLAPLRRCAPPRTVEDATWDLTNHGYLHAHTAGRYRDPAGDFAREMRSDSSWLPPALPESLPPAMPLNHHLRKHSPDIEQRFRIYQYLGREGIRPNILNIPMDAGIPRDERRALIDQALDGVTIPAEVPSAVLARNKGELVELLMSKGTKKHSQRVLKADQPSPTMMSLPDDFVHHVYPRTLTVREMARFQSFPDSFQFRSKETTGSDRRRFEVPQYTQVGNAVPPMLGRAVGERLAGLLKG